MDYSVFDSLIDSVFIIDSDRKIVYCNESAATLCESSVRRLTKGVLFYDVIRLSNDDLYAMPNGEWGKDEPTPYSEIDFETKRGKQGKVQAAIQPFHDGETQRWVVMLHDVTLEETLHGKYRAELEEKEGVIVELRKAQEKLEAYSKNLEQMVADRTAELRSVNQMLKAIMNSLGQGFLVFDQKGVCSEIYTRACEHILETKPAGQPIWEVLKLGDESEQMKMWLTASFSESLPFDSLKELAPQRYSHSEGNYITLEYYPIRDDEGRISNLVLVATDRTAEYKAGLALEKQKKFAQMVVKLVKSKDQFVQFLRSAREIISSVKQETEHGQQSDFDYGQVFRDLHTLEGESGSFSVDSLRLAARKAQEVIEPLRSGSNLSSDEFSNLMSDFKNSILELESAHRDFLQENKEIFAVINIEEKRKVEISASRLLDFEQRLVQSGVSRILVQQFRSEFLKEPISKYLRHMEDLARVVAAKQGKRLKPMKLNSHKVRIDPEPFHDFFDSLVHAIRNAVDHGIEEPDARSLYGKDEEGQIEIQAQMVEKPQGNVIILQIKDDGRGIDPDIIRNKLRQRRPDLEVDRLSDHDVIQYIFDPGFTSRDQVGEFSGRGVGMDAVKTEVERLGGRVVIDSALGHGTRLNIEIPEPQDTFSAFKKVS